MTRFLFTVLLIITGLIPLFSQEPLYDTMLRLTAMRDSGNYEEAVAASDAALEHHNDYRLFLQRGEARLLLGLYSEAADDFQMASDIMKGSGSFGLARSYAVTGEPAMVSEQLRKHMSSQFKKGEREIIGDSFLIRIENSPVWREFWRGNHYAAVERLREEVVYQVSLGRIDEALRMLDGFTGGDRSSLDYIYATALVNNRKGEYSKAVSLLKPLVPSGDPSGSPELLLVESYFGEGNYRAAISLSSGLIEEGLPASALLKIRAESYFGISDNRRALADIERYLGLYPFDSEALLLAAEVELIAGSSNNALRYLNRLVEGAPGSANAYSSRGNVWMKVRGWQNAISDFAMALDLDPYDADTWLNKGIALLNNGKREEACHDFHMALRYGNRTASRYINSNCIR